MRFVDKVEVDNETGCWNWTAYVNPRGYGEFGVHVGPEAAHRVSYELFVGPIPPGL